MDSRSNNRRGFTLIELLVAITVLAVVAVLGWRGLDGIVRSRVALTSEMDQTRGMQLTFAQLQSDCANIASSASISSADGIAISAPLVADQERLILVRTVFADDQPTRVQVVAYQLKEGVLTRRESAATRDLKELGVMWQIAMNGTDPRPAVVLQSGLAAMTMRTTDGTGWRAASGSPAATPAAPTAAPVVLTGLEMTLQLRDRANGMVKVFLLGAV